jgi:cell division septum initiation protein DivIVA
LAIAWYEEQRRLDPGDVLTVAFPAARRGRRGYEAGPVRELLRLANEEFSRLASERASLWQEVQLLRKRIIAGQAAGGLLAAPVLFGKDDSHVKAVDVVSTAQVTADRYVADAQAYSSQVTKEARQRRDDIMLEAEEYADMLLDEAHAKAAEAAAAVLNGAGLDGSAGPRTPTEQLADQAELAYLRTYGEVYRAHLRTYTDCVLQRIQEWEAKEAASLRAAAQEAAIDGTSLIIGDFYLG